MLVALLLAGCGGGPTLSRAGFQRRANRACASLQQASDAFAKAQAPGAQGNDVAKYLRAGANELRDLVDRVGELAEPDEMEDAVSRLLDLLGKYADGLDTLASRTGSQQTFQDVLQESPRVVSRLNTLAGKATTVVAELGLVGCVLPS